MILKEEAESQEWMTEIVKCMTKPLNAARRRKVIWGEVHLCNRTLKKSKSHSVGFPCQQHHRHSQGELSVLQDEILLQPPPSFSSSILGKSSMTSLGQPADFHPRERGMSGMHWCADTNKGSVCAWDADTWRNECPHNRVDWQGRSSAAHYGYATWEVY